MSKTPKRRPAVLFLAKSQPKPPTPKPDPAIRTLIQHAHLLPLLDLVNRMPEA